MFAREPSGKRYIEQITAKDKNEKSPQMSLRKK
jgi:hypothetical protein